MPTYYIKIDHEPVAKARARRGRSARWYTPDKTASYEKLIRDSFFVKHRRPLIEGPIDLTVRLAFPTKVATRIGQPHIFKPDADNLVKAIKDALNKIAWHDDAQIATLTVIKVWDWRGTVSITVKPMTLDGRIVID